LSTADGVLLSKVYLLTFRWHDPRILAATGAGVDTEEPRAWKGYWNEALVKESRQLYEDPEVLTVLLTGRSTLYVEIVNRILNSRQLKFHLVVLKPRKARGVNNNTLTFKYAFIDDILRLGKTIDTVEVYEDRAPHRDAFEDYLKKWRRIKETTGEEVVQDGIKTQSLELEEHSDEVGLKAFKVHFVTMPGSQLDLQVEEALVNTMVEETNAADMANKDEEYVMEKKIFSLGYQLGDGDFQHIFDTYMALSRDTAATTDPQEWRPIRQPSVFIYFNGLPHILDRVGGIGKQVDFEITHLGISNKAMALALSPIVSYHEVTTSKGETKLKPDSRVRFWSKNELPVLVLATKDGGKPADANFIDDWMAVPDSVQHKRFRATVGLRQEISIERISKVDARARREWTAPSPRQPSFPSKEHANGQTSERGGHRSGGNGRRGGGYSTGYGRGQNSPRNAFGYSLS
jgi:HAD domain family 1 in Swiss Army Knife RNA repair proteins